MFPRSHHAADVLGASASVNWWLQLRNNFMMESVMDFGNGGKVINAHTHMYADCTKQTNGRISIQVKSTFPKTLAYNIGSTLAYAKYVSATQPPCDGALLPTTIKGSSLHQSKCNCLMLSIKAIFSSQTREWILRDNNHVAAHSITALIMPWNIWCMGVSMHW